MIIVLAVVAAFLLPCQALGQWGLKLELDSQTQINETSVPVSVVKISLVWLGTGPIPNKTDFPVSFGWKVVGIPDDTQPEVVTPLANKSLFWRNYRCLLIGNNNEPLKPDDPLAYIRFVSGRFTRRITLTDVNYADGQPKPASIKLPNQTLVITPPKGVRPPRRSGWRAIR